MTFLEEGPDLTARAPNPYKGESHKEGNFTVYSARVVCILSTAVRLDSARTFAKVLRLFEEVLTMHARALAVSLRAREGPQLDTGAPHDSTRRILAR